jgi:hypothetical protein
MRHGAMSPIGTSLKSRGNFTMAAFDADSDMIEHARSPEWTIHVLASL